MGGGLQKISEVNVSSNTTYVDFTGLDGNSDWFYKLFAVVKNPTGSSTRYNLFVNGDTTLTNYYSQSLTANGSSTSAGRVNESTVSYARGNTETLFATDITKDPSGYFRFTSYGSREISNLPVVTIWAGMKTATITNITSLRVQANVSNAIGAGSKFILYRTRAG